MKGAEFPGKAKLSTQRGGEAALSTNLGGFFGQAQSMTAGLVFSGNCGAHEAPSEKTGVLPLIVNRLFLTVGLRCGTGCGSCGLSKMEILDCI